MSKYKLDDNLRARHVDGCLLSAKDTVFLITLYFGRLRILSTPAGTNNFQDAYYDPQSPEYVTIKTKLWIEKDHKGNQMNYHLFVTAMKMTDQRSDRQPIEVLHFLLNVYNRSKCRSVLQGDNLI